MSNCPQRAICLWIACLLLSLLLNACSNESRDSIRFGLSTPPVTLDPRLATDAVSHRINRLLYRQLVDFDEQQKPVPSLASWEKISDTHYRFTLGKQGRLFHNGTRLTATDVKSSYDWVLDSLNISPHRATLENIQDMRVINSNIIDFHLQHIDPLFPGRLVIGILPTQLIATNHPFSREPVGSGSFRFVDWSDESRLVLERVRDNQAVEFITVKDSTVRALKLLRGEIDIIQNDLPFELLNWLNQKETITLETRPGNTYSYLGFNLRDPVLKQRNIREAIAHGIDRKAIIRHVLGNAARPAGSILPPNHWSGHPELEPYTYDPDKARKLLKQSGFDETQRLSVEYKTSSNPLRLRLATIIQYQLKQIGIDLVLKSYDWGTFYGDIKSGQFQLYSLSWVGLKMPDIFRYAFHSDSVPPAGANRGYLNDDFVDQLIEAAEREADPMRQLILYRELQERLHDMLPYVSLWYEHNILARRSNIHGYRLSVDGEFDALNKVYRQNY